MRKYGRKNIRTAAKAFFLFFLLTMLNPVPGQAAELVMCRYLKASGNEITLELQIGSPPPASLIVIQNLPSDVEIVSSSPPIKKLSKNQGEAKWLLTGLSPGNVVLVLTLNAPVAPGQISGELRYKNPTSGAMVQLPIRP
jgi:hypothetical protein